MARGAMGCKTLRAAVVGCSATTALTSSLSLVPNGMDFLGNRPDLPACTLDSKGPESCYAPSRHLPTPTGVDAWISCGATDERAPEDFAAFIEVAASGPARINDDRALGLEIVRLQQPDS